MLALMRDCISDVSGQMNGSKNFWQEVKNMPPKGVLDIVIWCVCRPSGVDTISDSDIH
jgi:hypothetical protein